MPNDTTLIDRFWSKVDKEDGEDGCWVWSGSRTGSGAYGQVRNEWGAPDFAHRVAFRMANGPIPEGLFVCHRCDYPPCVRPSHLFLGTAMENIHDSIRKGRFHVKRRTMRRALATVPPIVARTVVISFRVTPEEFRMLARRADRKKCGVSDLVREGIATVIAPSKAA